MLKQIIKLFSLIIVLLFLVWPAITYAQEPATVYFFYGYSCPHCDKESKFLDQLEQEYGSKLIVKRYEVYIDKDGQAVFQKFVASAGGQVTGVPATFIGDQFFVGYGSDSTTGEQLRNMIDRCLAGSCPDIGAQILGEDPPQEPKVEPIEEPGGERSPLIVHLPFFGETDLSKYSLFGLTAVVAAIDGFNPCAMWVLLILIGLLLGMQNRKRMWFLGLTFIAASALVYFIFLAAWLEFFHFIGVVRPVQIIIGLFAFGVGIYYFRRFWKMKPGECEVTNVEQRRKITERIKKIVREQVFWLALIGIIGVAFVVNLIELACSAGLPAIYTQVLAISELSRLQYYLYLLLYVVIFMIDDMVIFVIAMVTMKAVGTTGKFSRWATLIGAVVILLLGVLLIFKPEWVMLG
jgi:glutaredoxin